MGSISYILMKNSARSHEIPDFPKDISQTESNLKIGNLKQLICVQNIVNEILMYKDILSQKDFSFNR